MIKLSNVDKYTEIPLILNEPYEKIEHEIEKNFSDSICFDDVIISRHPKKIKIWDIKKLPQINMISSFEIDWSGEFIKKNGNLLYVGQSKEIKVFDISDLQHPVLVRTVTFPNDDSLPTNNYVNFHITKGLIYVMIDKAIYVIDETNNFLKIIDLSENSAMMFDYPMDIKKYGNNLYMVFRHCGLYVYQQSEHDRKYKFLSKHKPVNGYTPTYMQWLNQGNDILLIGNDNVVQYNVTNGEKLKRYKAAKIGKSEIHGGTIERENELLVVGTKGSKDQFVTAIIQQDNKGIQLVNTPKLEYKARKKFGEGISGLALKDNYLLIIGRETGFFLFEARE
ncbi:LVIVD repeat-containing protein [Aquimarina macrocephali]|uniref:hypothetical protein n=1 Tax=Aquimarina macrocephali TaxID=666563 RepID=UPI0004635C73|nr:hypothetical protein [Aquimarina macrocephali]